MSQTKILLVHNNTGPFPENVLAIDVASPKFMENIPSSEKLYCLRDAYVYAIKFLPAEKLNIISSIKELIKDKPKEIKPVAARCDNIVVSTGYHEAVDDAKVWLLPYHIDLIQKLMGKGCVIELLDERSNLVRKIKGKDGEGEGREEN